MYERKKTGRNEHNFILSVDRIEIFTWNKQSNEWRCLHLVVLTFSLLLNGRYRWYHECFTLLLIAIISPWKEQLLWTSARMRQMFWGWNLGVISIGNYTSASFSQRVAPTAPFNKWDKRLIQEVLLSPKLNVTAVKRLKRKSRLWSTYHKLECLQFS